MKTLGTAMLLGLCGCASFQAPGQPLGERGRIGAFMCPSNDGISISEVEENLPAQGAGLRDGDTIVSFNGLALSRPENRREFYSAIGSSRILDLSVKRESRTVALRITPVQADISGTDPLFIVIEEEVLTGKKIAVAVIADEINSVEGDATFAWKAGVKTEVESAFEGILLQPHCPNFAVVDRRRKNDILDELRFQMTGAVPPDAARSIGRMTGATHLLFVSFTRFAVGDVTTARLVDVESGNVLASARLHNRR